MNKLSIELTQITAFISTHWLLITGAVIGSVIGWALAIFIHFKSNKRPKFKSSIFPNEN